MIGDKIAFEDLSEKQFRKLSYAENESARDAKIDASMLLDRLSEEEKTILKMRFGLSPYLEEHTYGEIKKSLSLKGVDIGEIISNALLKAKFIENKDEAISALQLYKMYFNGNIPLCRLGSSLGIKSKNSNTSRSKIYKELFKYGIKADAVKFGRWIRNREGAYKMICQLEQFIKDNQKGDIMLTVKGKEIKIDRSAPLVKQLEAAIVRGNRRLAIEDALLLNSACFDVQAKSILEIGSADGASTQVLGFAAQRTDGHLWAIEPVVRQRIKDNIAHCELEKHVTIIKGQSPYVQPHEHDIKTPLDVLFIDGNHKTQWVIGDYYYWKMFVRPDGIIVFHDWCGAGGNKAEIRLALEIILKTDQVYLEEWGRSEPKDKGAIAFKVREWIR